MPQSAPSCLLFLSSSIFFLLCITVNANTRTSTLAATSTSPCPPFTSTPPFPFSSSPGYGHPSFQLKCSSPHSLISINNVSFSLLRFQPDISSLQLSTNITTTANHTSTLTYCSSPLSNIPSHSINLSGTPFRVSDSSCAHLAVLRSCSSPNLPNCSHCPWHCNLIKNPAKLLHGCGSIPHQHLLPEQGCQIDVLEYLDSFLKQGFQVDYDDYQDPYFTNCKVCKSANGVCGFNSSDPQKPFICYSSKARLSPPWIHDDEVPNRIALFCSIFTLVSLLIIVLVVIAVFRSKRLKSLATGLEDSTTLFLQRHRSANLLPPSFTYEELDLSTNHFDPTCKIGDGGFGSVYLGRLHDGRIVAVKHLHHNKHHRPFSTKSFCNEILILSSINHPNLVKLQGYCSEPRGLLLVYDYVTNGTLADHLHGRNRGSLTWQMRIDIALQTALALEYLHFCVQPAVVHRDITSSNIFVEKDMMVKVGDFGLSRLLIFPDTSSGSSGFVWTGPQGTPGYLDPDYHRSFQLTEKSDVYSFGVVLLELVSGMRAVDQRRDKREMALAALVVSKIQMGLLHQVVDPVLTDSRGAMMEGVEAVAELAFRCVATNKDDRPDAREVVEELKRIRSRMVGSGDSNGKDDVAKD